MAGDAAGYFDPFTGQGVFRALLCGELAAHAIERCMRYPDGAAEALVSYEAELDHRIGRSRRLQHVIDGVTRRPWLMNPAARVLDRRVRLASRIVDATGDRLSAEELWSAGGWLAALLDRDTVASRREQDAYA